MPILEVELVGPVPDEVKSGLAARARSLTEAVASACDRPSQGVHVIYEPPARGRIAFGGQPRT